MCLFTQQHSITCVLLKSSDAIMTHIEHLKLMMIMSMYEIISNVTTCLHSNDL